MAGCPTFHNNSGLALAEQGRLDDAVVSYRRALSLKPDYADAHYNLAGLLRRQGRLDEAAAHYAHTVRLRPDHAAAHNDLGTAAFTPLNAS